MKRRPRRLRAHSKCKVTWLASAILHVCICMYLWALTDNIVTDLSCMYVQKDTCTYIHHTDMFVLDRYMSVSHTDKTECACICLNVYVCDFHRNSIVFVLSLYSVCILGIDTAWRLYWNQFTQLQQWALATATMTTLVEGAVEKLWINELAKPNSCAPSDEEHWVEALHSTIHTNLKKSNMMRTTLLASQQYTWLKYSMNRIAQEPL